MAQEPAAGRHVAADPEPGASGSGHLRREGSGDGVPADRGHPSARGRAQCADRDARRRRVRRVERVRRTVQHARPPNDWPPTGLKFNRFHTTALCSPTRQALLTGRNHHAVGHGRHHRDRDVGARLQLGAPDRRRAARGDDAAQRLQHRAVRQVPRGAGVGDEPDGAVPPVAHRKWFRVLLRLPRRRDEPVVPGAL